MRSRRYFPNTFLSAEADPGPVLEGIPVRIRQLLNQCMHNCTHARGGIYTGTLGVVYAAVRVLSNDISRAYLNKDELAQVHAYCEKTLGRVEQKLTAEAQSAFASSSIRTALFGIPGLYLVSILYLGVVEKPKERDEYVVRLNRYLDSELADIHEMEMLYGLTGILAILQELQVANVKLPDHDRIYLSTCKRIYKRAAEQAGTFARLHGQDCPALRLIYSWHDTYYIGAAHGISSSLQMLLHAYDKFDQEQRDNIRAAVDNVLALQSEDGNFPSSVRTMEEMSSRVPSLVQWCHGAAGVIYLMAGAYKVWRDQRYLDSCVRCAEVIWEKGLLTKGPGLCHGVAGNGYAFLLVYRMTRDERYLSMAVQFANFLTNESFDKQSRLRPDEPYSLFEGMAGEICFLCDLMDPLNSRFPLCDETF